jgi:haloalkane dehalogenase
MAISAAFPYQKKTMVVDGLTMAYVDEGDGDAIVFLHGNPTSSYLWRNVMPHLEGRGRIIAPDLIGMGDSDRLPDSGPGSYSFVEHRRYLHRLLDQLELGDRVTLVIHDWGSALGFHWAHQNPDRVMGIAYMEALVRPIESWDDWIESGRDIFQAMRSEAGEGIVIDKNLFVEAILPGSVLRDLTDEEMTVYRAPYVDGGETRRPTLTWPRQIPIEGTPPDVTRIIADYAEWLSSSPIPKLLVVAEPGAILTGAQLAFCRAWPNQTEVVVAGSHFCQEDSPDEIGQAIAAWRDGIAG